MLNGIFKGLYRGHGIYWFGQHGYGDETNPQYETLGAMRQAIDAKIAEEASRPVPAHESYWASLSESTRREWRRKMDWDSGLSVSEQAYAAR